MRRVILDCDPGCDDALALHFLLNRPDVELLAITTVNGNVDPYKGAINALKILKLNNATIPVFMGPKTQVAVEYESEVKWHGNDGLLDVEEANFEVDLKRIQTESAVQSLLSLVNKHPHEIDLVAVGPLTNVALAMGLDIEFGAKLKSLTIMGGNVTGCGNTTACAEFNFYHDPEAAHCVLTRLPKTVPGTIISWESTLKNQFSGEKIGLKRGSTIGDFLYPRASKMSGFDNPGNKGLYCICDLLAPIALLHPELVTKKEIHPVSVELSGMYTRGMMVLGRHYGTERPEFKGQQKFTMPDTFDMEKVYKIEGLKFS